MRYKTSLRLGPILPNKPCFVISVWSFSFLNGYSEDLRVKLLSFLHDNCPVELAAIFHYPLYLQATTDGTTLHLLISIFPIDYNMTSLLYFPWPLHSNEVSLFPFSS